MKKPMIRNQVNNQIRQEIIKAIEEVKETNISKKEIVVQILKEVLKQLEG